MDLLLTGFVIVTVAIYAMIDIANRSISLKNKVIWFPVVVLIPLFGPLFYFVFRRNLV